MLILIFAFGTQEENDLMSTVYEQYYNVMLRIAMSILHDKGQAEDIVHDAIIVISDHTDRVTQPEQSSAKYFIWKVTKNLAINLYNRNAKHPYSSIDAVDVNIESRNSMDEDDIVRILTVEETLERINEMSTENRDILIMYYLQGLTCPDIGKLLNIKPAAVRQRLKRAREQVGDAT